MKWYIRKLRMVVQNNTKVTAVPRPSAVLIRFEQTRKEHIPRKLANRMLFVKIEPTRMAHNGDVFIFPIPRAVEDSTY